jgi:hypothetical protein
VSRRLQISHLRQELFARPGQVDRKKYNKVKKRKLGMAYATGAGIKRLSISGMVQQQSPFGLW